MIFNVLIFFDAIGEIWTWKVFLARKWTKTFNVLILPMASKKISTTKVIFDCQRSDQPIHFQRSDQFKKYFRCSDPFQIFDQLLDFWRYDFWRSDPFPSDYFRIKSTKRNFLKQNVFWLFNNLKKSILVCNEFTRVCL